MAARYPLGQSEKRRRAGWQGSIYPAIVEQRTPAVRTRLSAAAPQVAVLGPLALVMGSRAGLSLEQIDDLAMAIELVVRHRRDERGAEFWAQDGTLEVFISEVDQAWLERHQGMLSVLVSEAEQDAGGLTLRVGAERAEPLAARAAQGDVAASEELVETMRPMVSAMATRFRGQGAAWWDLEQAGMVGLLRAVERGSTRRAGRRSVGTLRRS